MSSLAGQALASVKHYWRYHMAVALSVAAATAILTGALVVGSSMRSSLRALTLNRLQRIDEVFVGEHFFSRDLQRQLTQLPGFSDAYGAAEPGILFPAATVERPGDRSESASDVTVLGVEESFWNLSTRSPPLDLTGWSDDRVLLNRALADELGFTDEEIAAGIASVTVRIPKPSLLPNESALGRKQDLLENLVRLPVAGVVPDDALGSFALRPRPQAPRIVFMRLGYLQQELINSSLSHRASSEPINIVFLAGRSADLVPPATEWSKLAVRLRPKPQDLGLSLQHVKQNFQRDGESITAFDYWSLTSERLVFRDALSDRLAERIAGAKPVLTYLVNTMQRPEQHGETQVGIPYSMVAGVDLDSSLALDGVVPNRAIDSIQPGQIVLNEWAAKDLGVEQGDELELSYYLPESAHGDLEESSVRLQVAAIARLVEPVEPFRYQRRGPLVPAVFDTPPTLANDPHWTPEVPGLTDSESIDRWDLPFSTSERIRPIDDDYWNRHRTTPKAFLDLATARRLWSSRFGNTTGFRIPSTVAGDEIQATLVSTWREHPDWFGLQWIPVKAQGLSASSGTTPFDVLFLGLSSFVMVAALILLSLLFRLSLEYRSNELGLLLACGFRNWRLLSMQLLEGWVIAMAGAAVGVALGIAYAAAVVWMLKSWWAGAVGQTFIQLAVDWRIAVLSFFLSVAIALITIAWSVRQAIRRPARDLLLGRWERTVSGNRRRSLAVPVAALVLTLVAIALAVWAIRLQGEAQAGAFLGAGFLILAALILLVRRWLNRGADLRQFSAVRSLAGLAVASMQRHPQRSTLTIALVAVAAFLIVAISAFRLRPSEESTAGIEWIAQSVSPLFENLNTVSGQTDVLGQEHLLPQGTRVYGWRMKPGEDASCTNPYQTSQPRVLGAPADWIEHFDDVREPRFHWSRAQATTEATRRNPWRLLDAQQPSSKLSDAVDKAVPCVIDKNTAVYSLKLYSVGTVFTVQFDSGQQVTFRLVGMLENSILQGSILIGETDFVRVFPETSGYRFFLIDAESHEASEQAVATLRDRLSDQGFSAHRSEELLRQLLAVQNTYLSAFQTLGALGLLLGTFGLAAVEWRSVVERRRELALMRAMGFGPMRLSGLLLREQLALLAIGLAVGISAACVTTLPHVAAGGASVPWIPLVTVFIVIIAIAALVGGWSARTVLRLALVNSLRSG